MINLVNKYFYLIIIFAITYLPSSITYADYYPLGECKSKLDAKPHILESPDRILRYIQLPNNVYDLKIDDIVYNQSGFYLIDGTSKPVWKINEYLRNSESAISDDGTYVVTASNTDYGIRFYKHGELIKDYKPWTLVIDKSKGGIVSDTPYYIWLKNTKYYSDKNLLFLKTIDDILYVFDITTGEIMAATGNMRDATEIPEYHKIENRDTPGKFYPSISADLLEYYQNEEDSFDKWIEINNEDYHFTVSIDIQCANLLAENNINHNAVIKSPKPKSSGKECEQKHAGYGKRARGVCFDLIGDSSRGPLMVVVPQSDEFQKNFAISSYEISVGDYTKYCTLSNNCEPITDMELHDYPLRNISLHEVKTYAQWLSETTRKTYRLPTTNEWEYAANANGNIKMKKDFNCRVVLGDHVIKGADIVSVKTGRVNDWGLKNIIGNVQEWVIDGDKVTARGGAYTDTFEECDISLSRPHSGDADEITGFRLVLEEVL